MESPPLEDLVRQCRRALPEDTRPFELLVQACSRRVYTTAYRLLGDAHDADDMAQEVFLKVYHGITDLAEPATFLSWLYRITTNTCLDYLERKGRRPRTAPLASEGEDGAEGYLDPTAVEPEDAALQAEVRRCIERTLAGLSREERAVIVLRDVEDRPYQEIADALAVGLGAVKMRIHRARLASGRLLESICPDTWRRHRPAVAAALGGPGGRGAEHG